ncbi:DUF2332 domain-containing protein [Frigidibacter sp. ROC022]|uniref:DUF2332 domain-containing protein n=1 Tax=Frigidibacter sp. ROC022 TaxID=2971796 RepID=UPI00215A157B|nr:DUF2332 family protein [Frigidibacter sp. ROC022]MCR8722832.1 DUF2332 family protein [Frigidibacter sp. ROC022]
MSLAAALEGQARACDELGSPFTARLCRSLARVIRPGTALTDRLLGWAGDLGGSGDSVPLRLTGALHALVLQGSDAGLTAVYPPREAGDAALDRAVAGALARHAGFIDRFIDSPPQTNEVGRSAVLIAAGHFLAARFGLPMALSELGASAGLNLNWDRYALRLGDARLGPRDAALELTPERRGGLPPEAAPEVIERRGVDLNPIDLGDPAQRLRLQAYVWPDQPARLDRLRRALALPPAPLDRGDAAAWLEARLAGTGPGRLHLVYHTIAWQYFPAETRAACSAALEAAGARATAQAPLAHLAMEADQDGPGAGLTLRFWAGQGPITIPLGRADFHGRWLDWQPQTGA